MPQHGTERDNTGQLQSAQVVAVISVYCPVLSVGLALEQARHAEVAGPNPPTATVPSFREPGPSSRDNHAYPSPYVHFFSRWRNTRLEPID
jgi:hypothetical protein